ncbi:phage tail sheath subtilisin-like domain-containing protein [Anaerotignum sp. MB30-C6]|uniref:phage tail sheath subtilisin-like domain-containing protein n=1 Tax=Anaerotignum sp. MB30-C6 TaxID=3070814 RepID=UPI0027DC5A7D|nr:phage tail sheath subtilisin-like domain-containing protein [Anaerotignum sp. MB30-C6]WMI81597.1 phage tail sheath subtilisin-like domain-containing protein [Anaerotignum sp. MB30-C6]
MGLPNILIEFKSKASTAIRRGERGIVAVMVVEATMAKGVTKLEDITQIPEGLTAENRAYVERAFLGGASPVKYVQLIITDTIENGLKLMEVTRFDYVAVPPAVTTAEATTIATFIKGLRDNKGIKVKAVLPNTKADHEGIINFTTSDIVVGENTFTTGEYCSRIASLLAGTPLSVSATYYVLSEVDDVPKFTKSELDDKINAGELVIFHDGRKVKVARGVNSLTTIGQEKSEDYKSTKIVDIMDLIYTDIKVTCEDAYVGKFANNYDNKCKLIVSIQAYLEALRDEELLDKDIVTGIDMAAQRNYLKGKGVDLTDMKEQEVKEANTQTFVFLMSKYKILNAIEDISVNFYI